jgi:hypothetical protein
MCCCAADGTPANYSCVRCIEKMKQCAFCRNIKRFTTTMRAQDIVFLSDTNEDDDDGDGGGGDGDGHEYPVSGILGHIKTPSGYLFFVDWSPTWEPERHLQNDVVTQYVSRTSSSPPSSSSSSSSPSSSSLSLNGRASSNAGNITFSFTSNQHVNVG